MNFKKFADYVDDMGTLVDDEMGEWFILQPMRKPLQTNVNARMPNVNDRNMIDDSRPVLRILGIFRHEYNYEPGDLHKGNRVINLSLSEPYFIFDRKQLSYEMIKGDIFTRCCNGEVYEISDIKPGTYSRIETCLVQRGRNV